jgi:mannose/fructose/N-acetylgalactosamine-specific phosphotransferase system component IID
VAGRVVPMRAPIIGRALPTVCVAVIPTLAVSGSLVAGVLVAVGVYPFVHLWFRWVAFRAPKGGRK